MSKKIKDSLGTRMKNFYEGIFNYVLPRRTNVIIRLDGKAFHTYTQGLKKPYDVGFNDDMDETTKYLCKNIQGCKCGYVQSDEISLLLTDYDNLETDAWFGNKIQKIVSVAASMATSQFNKLRIIRASKDPLINGHDLSFDEWFPDKMAEFDARVFIIPSQEEVVNYFLWRQQDAIRNSISMLAQAYFSHKELYGKKTNEMLDMLLFQKDIAWSKESIRFKHGGFVKKITYIDNMIVQSYDLMQDGSISQRGIGNMHSKWETVEIPIISKDRDFIKNLMP